MATTKILRNPWLIRAISFGVFLAAWQILANNGSSLTFAPPGEMVNRFYGLWTDGEMPTATINTLESTLVGFALAVVVAVPLGLLMGTSRTAEYIIDPYVSVI